MGKYRTLYICATCGGENVFCDAWAGLNDDRLLKFEATHCEDCEGECSVVEREIECGAENL